MNILIYGIIAIIIGTIIETNIKKKYDIKREGVIYKCVNRIHLWIEISVASILFVIFLLNNDLHYFVPTFLILLNGIRSFMEWKYRKSSREYILYIFNLCFFSVFLLGIMLFFPEFR